MVGQKKKDKKKRQKDFWVLSGSCDPQKNAYEKSVVRTRSDKKIVEKGLYDGEDAG